MAKTTGIVTMGLINEIEAKKGGKKMKDKTAEWMKQVEYDLDTAKYMISGGRYFYAVFMCHMCLKKALKALYQEKKDEVPPKTHNLILLLTKLDIKPGKIL